MAALRSVDNMGEDGEAPRPLVIDESASGQDVVEFALETLQEADEALEALPHTDDVRNQRELSFALHVVLLCIARGDGPVLDREQQSTLVDRVVCLARLASDLRQRLACPETHREPQADDG